MLPFIRLHFLCTHFWQLVHCIELLRTPLPHTAHGYLAAFCTGFWRSPLIITAHCEVQGLPEVSCAKMAELIEMQFGMLSQVSPWNMYYIVEQTTHRKGHFWVVWLIGKHCKAQDFWGLVKGWAVQKMGGPIITIHMSCAVFLHKELSFASCDDCTCIKFFSGIINRD